MPRSVGGIWWLMDRLAFDLRLLLPHACQDGEIIRIYQKLCEISILGTYK